jgi:hypothetical protein
MKLHLHIYRLFYEPAGRSVAFPEGPKGAAPQCNVLYGQERLLCGIEP